MAYFLPLLRAKANQLQFYLCFRCYIPKQKLILLNQIVFVILQIMAYLDFVIFKVFKRLKDFHE